ncbi:hypothetical protein P7H16_12990 [Paenibacillus larvae]|nr:hypothetical protein [Paenibacillus larvae]MDT2247648.1 hypothetical protein [Paenibacillus larvae]
MRNIWEAVAEETSEALQRLRLEQLWRESVQRGDAGIHRQLQTKLETASYEGIEGTRSRVRTRSLCCSIWRLM